MAIRIRSAISPMFGHSPATRAHAIRTGSWLAREALTKAVGARGYAAGSRAVGLVLLLAPFAAIAAPASHPAGAEDITPTEHRHLPYLRLTRRSQSAAGK